MADAARAVAVPFVVTRAGVLIVGLAAAVFIGYTPKPGPMAWRVSANPALNLLARWDAYWYLDIATRGYHWNGNPIEQQNVVFFPLLPLLMRVGGAAIGGHPLIAGLGVSLTAFLLALCYFWRWSADRLGAERATAAVWLLSAFPLALFFSAVYTESLYLLIAVAACYHAERRQFARSAMFGLMGGLVRPNGVLLAVPLACIAWIRSGGDGHRVARSATVLAPVLGLGCYSAYLACQTGDGFAWLSDQAAWPNNLGIAPPDTSGSSLDLNWLTNAIPLGLMVYAIVPVTSLLGVAYGLFVAANIAPPLIRHGLMSLGRFSSVMFPVFAWLAVSVPIAVRTRLIVAFALGQVLLAALFFTWHAIL
jgi:hypothetical protein